MAGSSEASRQLSAEYSQLAESYGRYWAPVINPMAYPLLDAMPLGTSASVLDMGSGTGSLWPALQQRAPGARICGVDGAQGMLRAGGAVLRGRVAVMDAGHLGLRPASFDAALLIFVLFHIPDPAGALGEVATTLKPGGTLGLAVWGEDPGLPGVGIWTEELDRAGAPPDPRDPAVMRQSWMDTPAKLTALLKQGSLIPQRVWSQRFVHPWTAETLLATQSRCGFPSRRLKELSADARRECIERVGARLCQLGPSDLEYRVEIIYAMAKPPVPPGLG